MNENEECDKNSAGYRLGKNMDFENFGNMEHKTFYIYLFFNAVKDCVDDDKFKEIEKSYQQKINDISNIKIKDTSLEYHIMQTLSYANIHTLGDYIRRNPSDILRIKGFGIISNRKINDFIAKKTWIALSDN